MFAYITEEEAYIQKRGGNFVIGHNNECVMEIPEEGLESLTLIDSVQVSSQAMVELLRLGVPVTWLSRTRFFFGRLESTRHVNVFRQERQILMKGSGFYLRMGKKVIGAKVHNQLTILRRYQRNADIEGSRSLPVHLSVFEPYAGVLLRHLGSLCRDQSVVCVQIMHSTIGWFF